MIALLDIGNSTLKWAMWRGMDQCLESQRIPRCEHPLDVLLETQLKPAYLTRIVACSVGGKEATRMLQIFAQRYPQLELELIEPKRETAGVRNAYPEASRLGADRWVALLAAHRRWPEAVVIIDAGTAITIDFLDTNGEHRGGTIFPGLRTMSRSLDVATAQLSDWAAVPEIPADNTAAGIAGGVRAAASGGIARVIAVGEDKLGRRYRPIFTGGDAQTLAKDCAAATVDADLTLFGLAVAAGLTDP